MSTEEKTEWLETLKRLKRHTELAIELVESDRLRADHGQRFAPGTFRIGDFAIMDRTKLTK